MSRKEKFKNLHKKSIRTLSSRDFFKSISIGKIDVVVLNSILYEGVLLERGTFSVSLSANKMLSSRESANVNEFFSL